MINKVKPLTPEDFLHFVETDEFADDWQALGLDVEQDLWDLQILIMSGPESAPVIRGTGGLRKLRFSSERSNVGKSGAVRVCYAYFPKFHLVLLVTAYGKVEKESLSATEKAGMKAYLEQIEKYLATRKI